MTAAFDLINNLIVYSFQDEGSLSIYFSSANASFSTSLAVLDLEISITIGNYDVSKPSILPCNCSISWLLLTPNDFFFYSLDKLKDIIQLTKFGPPGI